MKIKLLLLLIANPKLAMKLYGFATVLQKECLLVRACLCWWFALNRKVKISGKVLFAFVYDFKW